MSNIDWLKTVNSISDGKLMPKQLKDVLFNKPKVYAEKILGEEAVTASITLPMQELSKDKKSLITQTITIPFYMENDFSLGTLSNKWSDLVDFSFANDFSRFLNGAVGTFTGSAQVAMQSEAMSTKVWQGSEFQGFNVSCLFLCTNRRINPTKIIRTLSTAALPTKAKDDLTGATQNIMSTVQTVGKGIVDGVSGLLSNAIGGASVLTGGKLFDEAAAKNNLSKATETVNKAIEDVGMVAPLHYGIDQGSDGRAFMPIPGTTLTLQVGNYFRASELLVQSIGNITFSKEVIAPKWFNAKGVDDMYDPQSTDDNYEDVYGFPLYGRCSLSLIPCAMLTKEKFEGYFIDDHAEPKTGGVFGTLASALKLPTA